MTTYSKPYNREQLAELISRTQVKATRKLVEGIALEKLNSKSDYKALKMARKMTGLDFLNVSNNKFIIRYTS